MKIPERHQLPIEGPEETYLIDSQKLAEFHRAFDEAKSVTYLPPSLGAMALQGVFTIINSLEIDWRDLLHATQRFEYPQKKFEIPKAVRAKSRLIDSKFRAKMHWLNFEIELRDQATNEILVTGKSLLMVKAEGG